MLLPIYCNSFPTAFFASTLAPASSSLMVVRGNSLNMSEQPSVQKLWGLSIPPRGTDLALVPSAKSISLPVSLLPWLSQQDHFNSLLFLCFLSCPPPLSPALISLASFLFLRYSKPTLCYRPLAFAVLSA